MKPAPVSLFLFLFLRWLTPLAYSGPVVSVAGPDYGWVVIFSGQAYAASWTESLAYPDANITARLTSFGRAGETGKAYLSTALGPSTTPSALVASTAFTFPTQTADVLLFMDLDLGPGSYYLSLIGDSPSWGSGWFGADRPTVQTAPGVSLGLNYGFQTREPFLPASQVFAGGSPPRSFSVFSAAAPVPEPSAQVLALAAGVLVTGTWSVRRRRRSRRAQADHALTVRTGTTLTGPRRGRDVPVAAGFLRFDQFPVVLEDDPRGGVAHLRGHLAGVLEVRGHMVLQDTAGRMPFGNLRFSY